MDQFTLSFAISLLAASLTTFIAVYAWGHRHSRGATAFALVMFAVSVWTLSVGLGMISKTETIAYDWAVIRMGGVISVPVLWLIFAFSFTGRGDWIQPKTIVWLSFIPLLSIALMVTTQGHKLFIEEIIFFQTGPFLVDETWVLGPYFWVHLFYSYVLILFADYLILVEAVRLAKQYRKQGAALILATFLPLAFNASYTFHFIPWLKINYDPLGFVLSSLIFAWALFFYHLLDLAPIARRVLVDNLPDGMIVLDNQNRIVDINPAAKFIFGTSPEQVIGKPITNLIPSLSKIRAKLARETDGQAEINLAREKDVYTYGIKITTVRQRGRVLGQLITLRDITKSKRVEQDLIKRAILDELTGLFNHGYFYQLLDQEIKRSIRYQFPLSVILFDLDYFKEVNDCYGHLVGDNLLHEIGLVCQQTLRGTDIACRYGGDEFAIILPETDVDEAARIGERLRLRIESRTLRTSRSPVSVTISAGVASMTPGQPTTDKALIEQADTALYRSKSEGRNRVTVQRDE